MRQLSPATEKVYAELMSRKDVTGIQDLVDSTRLARRTVRYAIETLRKRNLVGGKINPRDMRRHLYFVINPAPV